MTEVPVAGTCNRLTGALTGQDWNAFATQEEWQTLLHEER